MYYVSKSFVEGWFCCFSVGYDYDKFIYIYLVFFVLGFGVVEILFKVVFSMRVVVENFILIVWLWLC